MSSLSETMRGALGQFAEQGHFEGYRRSTAHALMRRGLVNDAGGKYELSADGQAIVSESMAVPRSNRLGARWQNRYGTKITKDYGTTDYDFWDKVRKCKATGLETAGVFVKPIASKKAAWVLGMLPEFVCENERTAELLGDWFRGVHSQIIKVYEEAVGLGDAYVVCNPDMSVTVVPPQVVLPLVNEEDYSQMEGWQIQEVYQHPIDLVSRQVITDEYRLDGRTRWIEKGKGKNPQPKFWKNLLSRIPMVHVANNRGADELFGHPEVEALLNVFHYYGEVIDAAVVGNRRQGRPTPVIEKMGSIEAVEKFWEQFGRNETQTLPDGTTETVVVLDFSADDLLTLGGDGTFKYAQPGAFTGDTMNILQILYYLIIQHTELPEFIFGNAIQGSKASAEAQLPPFIKWVEKMQGEAQAWLMEIVQTMVEYFALVHGDVSAADEVSIVWKPLTEDDDKLTLEAIKLGLEHDLLDDETALSLMPLPIDNPADVLAKMKAQLEDERDQFDKDTDAWIDALEDEVTKEPPSNSPRKQGENNPMEMGGYAQGRLHVREMGDGAMIALVPPMDVAERLAELFEGYADATPASEMHITLAYLGKADELALSEKELRDLLMDELANWSPFRGSITGTGRFTNTNHSEGKDAYLALVDAPELPEFRQAIVKRLEDAGIRIPNGHGFIPHMTLVYLDKHTPTPEVNIGNDDMVFGDVVLAVGRNWQYVPIRQALAV